MRSASILILALLAACSQAPQDSKPTPETHLTTNRIDADSVVQGLPLSSPQKTPSGNGRTKQVWRIAGSDSNTFEIIGNDQADADLVGWNCADYDQAGARIPPLPTESRCHKLFADVLGRFVVEGAQLAETLISDGVKSAPRSAVVEAKDFSFETDGEFFFVRRLSRMK